MMKRCFTASILFHALLVLVAMPWRIEPRPAAPTEPTRVDFIVLTLAPETTTPGESGTSDERATRPLVPAEIPDLFALDTDFIMPAYTPPSSDLAATRAQARSGGTGGVERPPVPLFVSWPTTSAAPSASSQKRRPVRVRVRVEVGGEVSRAEFAEGTYASAADSAALEVAMALRFDPARRSGRAVAAWTTVEIGLGR